MNLDPKRGEGHSSLLSHVEFDDVMIYYLASKGMTKNTIPKQGQKVILRNNGNLSSGGSAEDVTDQIHPETVYQCEMACRQIGLNICGLDIVCNDITNCLRFPSAWRAFEHEITIKARCVNCHDLTGVCVKRRKN